MSGSHDEHKTTDSDLWNYHPKLPIVTGGIFNNILNPVSVLKGIIFPWFGTYIRGLFLIFISLLWLLIFPAIGEIKFLRLNWIVGIFSINYSLMIL